MTSMGYTMKENDSYLFLTVVYRLFHEDLSSVVGTNKKFVPIVEGRSS